MRTGEFITAVIIFGLSGFLMILGIRHFMEKGFLMNNAFLYALKGLRCSVPLHWHRDIELNLMLDGEDAATAHKEIELLHNAILACGRPIVLSLSPGPAKISEAAYYAENANIWRITDDFWDSWPLLKDMFRRMG